MASTRHFLTLRDFSKDEICEILRLSMTIKHKFLQGERIANTFQNRILAMIFEKSSTRTRVSFEAGAYQLGGSSLFLSNKDIQIGRGETIQDTARVISSMVDMVMIRTYEHTRIEEFARYSSVPVINGLSDESHPTQLIADFLTMIENGITIPELRAPYVNLQCRKPIVCYIGDGNNVAHSWLMFAAKLGFELRIATPKEFAPENRIVEAALGFAAKSGAKITLSNNPQESASGANVIATDTWISMGQEEDKERKVKIFSGFGVDENIMKLGDSPIFLHCLPAYRGYEVSDEVIESKQSKVFEEAQNRLHAHKGIITFLGEQAWSK